MKSSYAQRGFTLVELLVVAAIIAILTALVLAGVRSSLVNGKKVQCQSQLRQLQLAITMYANDNGRNFPTIDNNDPAGSNTGFMHYLGTYVENVKPTIFQCTNPGSVAPVEAYYSYNDEFTTNQPAGLDKLSSVLGIPISQITLFSCRSGLQNGATTGFMPHGKGINVLYGDGRVVFEKKG